MESKRVFIPVSDELLNDPRLENPQLVPFNPAFLVPKADRKPRNWISSTDFGEALRRLRASQDLAAV